MHVPLREANVVVWNGAPEQLAHQLHDGVSFVQLTGAGIENWFKAGVVDDERLWAAAKCVNAQPVAEYIVAVILAGARRLPEVAASRKWQPLEPRLLATSTVGIVGAGGVGQAAIRMLGPFGPRVLALTRSGRQIEGALVCTGPDGLAELLHESDFVVLAVPETPETFRMLSARQFSMFREGAWLINVGRGSAVDTQALLVRCWPNRRGSPRRHRPRTATTPSLS